MLNRSYSHKDVLTRASMTLQLVEDVAIYVAKIFSSNGNIFGSGDNSTELHLTVFKGLKDITDNFTDIEWKRFTSNSGSILEDLEWGKKHFGKKSITITKEDIKEKANIQVEVFAQINEERTLVATDFITFIDINDMQGSNTPPENPKHGDLWLDTSVTPPRLKMWDESLGMWVEVAIAGKERRNLIRNSNFYKKDYSFWNDFNSPIKSIESLNGKRWARLRNTTAINKEIGISQTVDASPKAKYSFQVESMIYSQATNTNINGNMCICFYSINGNTKTLIGCKEYDIKGNANVYTYTFESLDNTSKIEVVISGIENELFDFLVTNIKLENYPVPTAWEIAIEDIQDALDNKVGNTYEEVFNSLTDNGNMQGLYVDTNEQGKKNYYFNGSYIKSGKVLGEFIEAKNLVVTRSDNTNTLEIDNKGDISIAAKRLQIIVDGGLENAATQSDIAYKVEINSSNGLSFSNGNISTVLTAKAFRGKINITSELDASCYNWTKTKADGFVDTIWNNTTGKGVKSINITQSDVLNGRATFTCTITKNNNVLASSQVTLIDVYDGQEGSTGIGIQEVINYYLATNASSNVTKETMGWTTTIQNVSATNKYLWNYEKIIYTEGDPQTTEPCIIGVYGDKGNDGQGIALITEYYAVSSNNTTAPSGTDVWKTTLQQMTPINKYLWNYERITYTGGTWTDTTPVIIGIYGDKGDKGDSGNDAVNSEKYDGVFADGKEFWECNNSTAIITVSKPSTTTVKNPYGCNSLLIEKEAWMLSKNHITIDASKVYKFTFRVKINTLSTIANTNIVYAGMGEYDINGIKLNTNYNYFVANKQTPTYNSDATQNNWTEYVGYVSVEAKNAVLDADGQELFPKVNAFTTNAVTFRPMFVVNYKNGNGITEVDALKVEEVTFLYESAKVSKTTSELKAEEKKITAKVETIEKTTYTKTETKGLLDNISFEYDNILRATNYEETTINKISKHWMIAGATEKEIVTYNHANNKDEDKFLKNNKVLKLDYTITESARQTYFNPITPGYTYIHLKPNTDYVYSGYIYVSDLNASNGMNWVIWSYDDTGNNKTSFKSSPSPIIGNGGFQRIDIPFTTNNRSIYQIQFYINGKTGTQYVGSTITTYLWGHTLSEGKDVRLKYYESKLDIAERLSEKLIESKGNPNLQKNSAFRKDIVLHGWRYSSAAGGTAEIISDFKCNGYNSVKLKRTGRTDTSSKFYLFTNPGEVLAKKGETYTVAFDYYIPENTADNPVQVIDGTFYIGLYYYDVNSNSAGTAITYLQDNATIGEWTRVNTTLTATLDTVHSVALVIGFNKNFEVYVSRPKIEYGEFATAFNEHVDDLPESVSAVETKVGKLEVKDTEILGQVNKIQTVVNKVGNPMKLAIKKEHNTFSGASDGEFYVHGLDALNRPTDIDGYCMWHNVITNTLEQVTLPKQVYNPDNVVPAKIPIYIVRDIKNSVWLSIWKEELWDESQGTNITNWYKVHANITVNNTPTMFNTWKSTDVNDLIFVGYYVRETSASESNFESVQLFNGAITYQEAINMSINASYGQIKVLSNAVSMKVDTNGVIASINAYTQTDESGTTSGVKISGDKIDFEGQVTFSSLSNDDKDGLKSLFKKEGNFTTINGGAISTKSIQADSIDLLSGFTVKNKSGEVIFAIGRDEDNADGTKADTGTIEINGLLHSSNYVSGKSGYRINTDGTAELNQAMIRGTLDVLDAGITNEGTTDNSIRIWAGSSYAGRNNARFRVSKRGDVFATDCTLQGTMVGALQNNNIHIEDGQIIIDNVVAKMSNEAVVMIAPRAINQSVLINKEKAIFNTEFQINNGAILYNKDNEKMVFDKNTDLLLQGNQTSIEIKSEDTAFGGLNIIGPSSGLHVLRGSRNSDKQGTLVFDAQGAQGAVGDFSFTRKNYEEKCIVHVHGNLSINEKITSDVQSIELKSINYTDTSTKEIWEGWGFYSNN